MNNQNSNTIKNPKAGTLPEQKGPQFNDRDILNDILATEKYLSDNFNVFAREASYDALHTDAITCLNETQQCARNLFNAMFQRGWYKFEGADQQQIQQAEQQFTNYQSQLPYGTMQ